MHIAELRRTGQRAGAQKRLQPGGAAAAPVADAGGAGRGVGGVAACALHRVGHVEPAHRLGVVGEGFQLDLVDRPAAAGQGPLLQRHQVAGEGGGIAGDQHHDVGLAGVGGGLDPALARHLADALDDIGVELAGQAHGGGADRRAPARQLALAVGLAQFLDLLGRGELGRGGDGDAGQVGRGWRGWFALSCGRACQTGQGQGAGRKLYEAR